MIIFSWRHLNWPNPNLNVLNPLPMLHYFSRFHRNKGNIFCRAYPCLLIIKPSQKCNLPGIARYWMFPLLAKLVNVNNIADVVLLVIRQYAKARGVGRDTTRDKRNEQTPADIRSLWESSKAKQSRPLRKCQTQFMYSYMGITVLL